MGKDGSCSSSSLHEGGEAGCEPPSKRPRVAASDRKRVAKACSSCRRLKEKCDGNGPCGRCVRYRRICGPDQISSERLTSSTISFQEDLSQRLPYLETIARHFLGDESLDTGNLKRIVGSLESRPTDTADRPTSEHDVLFNHSATARCVAIDKSQNKLSDGAFLTRLHHDVQSRLKQAGVKSDVGFPPPHAEKLLLPSISSFCRDSLPPKDVTIFLVGVYLDLAQTTTLVVEKTWVNGKVEQLYSSTELLSPQDHPWLCSVLMVLATGVRYAYLTDAVSQENLEVSQAHRETECNREASLQFYHLAAELVSDVLLVPCVDSMRAFLLLAQFAMASNETGLAYSYIGAATRIAARLNSQEIDSAHQFSLEERAIFHKLCHSAHAWDIRICILHGISPSQASSSIDVAKLEIHPADAEQQQISPEASTTLFVQLTDWLEEIAQTISSHSLKRLIRARSSYKKWWSELNISQIPILQLNRQTAPLHLCYHLNVVMMGRHFAFEPVESIDQTDLSAETHNGIAELVDEAEYSAYEIIDICSMVDKSNGLSGASYIESSACRAAVLVMLVQSLIGRCPIFQAKLHEGLNLVRKMAQNATQYDSALSTIETINSEIDKLAPHKRNQKYKTRLLSHADVENAYKSFKDWAKVGRKPSSTVLPELGTLTGEYNNGGSELQNIFNCDLLDPSWFSYDSIGFSQLEQGLEAY